MRHDNGFPLLVFAVLESQHVDFSLVDTELAEINVQEEDIGTLHAWIEELGDLELVRLFLAHDRCAFLDSRDRVLAGDVHHPHPIFI